MLIEALHKIKKESLSSNVLVHIKSKVYLKAYLRYIHQTERTTFTNIKVDYVDKLEAHTRTVIIHYL